MNFVCKDVEAYLAEFIANEGDGDARGRVQAHLNVCSSCRSLAQEQTAMRRQLRLLAARDASQIPPGHLWERAASTWNALDVRRKRSVRARWALAGSSLMLLLFSIVWANLASGHEFPVEAVLRDFRGLRAHAPTPRYATEDPDKAARWLREHLRAELPPVNLTLSQGELLGADVITTPQQLVGRLLYHTPQGIAAVYLAPESAQFTRMSEVPIGTHTFYLRNNTDVGMYGWKANMVGCGLLLNEPIGAGRSLAVNAAHATEEKEDTR